MQIGEAIMEPMKVHKIGETNKKRKELACHLLEEVGMPADFFSRYPHQFSGGQRQRICIARALSLNPDFLICDESVSALDVSVQAQVLNLLKDLKQKYGLTMIFISHDLSVIKHISDHIAVMNHGKIVEFGRSEEIFNNPLDDYTTRLIEAIPAIGL
jgi:peptide/nickel transport system ATP-binding protein